MKQWDAATYTSVAQSILDHSARKGIEPLKYLRKAHNFNKKGAIRVPKTGYRGDSSAIYGSYLPSSFNYSGNNFS
jgi:hypothetical protein